MSGTGLDADDAGKSDAGAGARVSDPRVGDAGVSGAGMSDAGMSDAGMSDAGMRDAGMRDAGMRDTSATDARATDAGMSDTSATDAGMSDTSVWFRRLDALQLPFALPLLGLFVVAHAVFVAVASDSPLMSRRLFEPSALRLAVELCLVGLPWLLHVAWGFGTLRRPGSGRLVLRVTGFAALAFLLWHLLALRVELALGTLAPDDVFYALAGSLSGTALGVPWTALAALVGIVLLLAHAAQGFSRLWQRRRPAPSRASRRARDVALTVVAVALGLVYVGVVVRYATGALWH